MSSSHFLFVVLAPALPKKLAARGKFVHRCIDRAAVRLGIKAQDIKRIEVTSDQWRFLRGVYAMNGDAPPGLPCGDDAVLLAQAGGDTDSLLFFIGSDKPCPPMEAPPELLKLMELVATPAQGVVH
ncbi:MAG: hypothetical protein JOZ28_10295 [Candidatus Eremiobacteraeota bacterium]|nr:hypothetical protein [Candidatus Eremiobacteraeota bacterium]